MHWIGFFETFLENLEIFVGVTLASTLACLFLIRDYFSGATCHCTRKQRLNGKTVIITGGYGGIGKETAKALASRGARIVLAGIDMDKANKVVNELKKSTKNDQIRALHLNLTSFASVRNFVEEFLASEPRLDILINNAGAFYLPRSITEDGNEITFQTNYLGHFLLTLLLLDRLKAFAPSRIINVSSMAYKQCFSIQFDDLLAEKSFDRREAYDHSKFAQVLFTHFLAKKLKGTGVTVNALHPGVVNTSIFKFFPWLSNPITKFLNLFPVLLFFKTPKEGAQTTIHCAISRECKTVTGCYFRDCAIESLMEHATDDISAARLWEESLKLVGLPQQ